MSYCYIIPHSRDGSKGTYTYRSRFGRDNVAIPERARKCQLRYARENATTNTRAWDLRLPINPLGKIIRKSTNNPSRQLDELEFPCKKVNCNRFSI